MVWNVALFFACVLVGAGLVGLMASLALLRDPMRETIKQERADARALRKENAMSMKDRLVGAELAWRERARRRARRYEGRHRRGRVSPIRRTLKSVLTFRNLVK